MARVLLIGATGQLGGAERSLVEMAEAINPGTFQLFAAVGGEGPLQGALEDAGVRTEIIPMKRLRRTVNPLRLAEYVTSVSRGSRAIVELAKSTGADLIHANNDIAQVYAGEAAARAELPCVWHSRDLLKLGPIGERMAKQASVVVAISRAVMDHHERAGVDPDRLRLVRNGVALGKFPECTGDRRNRARLEARKELGLHPDAFVVGAAGVFVPWKRHEDFIRAFCGLCEREIAGMAAGSDVAGGGVIQLKGLVPARAVLFGDDLMGDNGRYVYDLKKLADELVGERVVFAGWREDLPRMLPALDAMVSASDREPFGRVLVEAMACGLPVIATDSGGKAEIVEADKTGIVVPQGDIGALAEAMDSLSRDPALRTRLGAAGRERAFEVFSVERTAREVEAVYREVLEGR